MENNADNEKKGIARKYFNDFLWVRREEYETIIPLIRRF